MTGEQFNAILDEEIAQVNKEIAMRPKLPKPIPTKTQNGWTLVALFFVLIAFLAAAHWFLMFTKPGHAVLAWIWGG